MTNYGHDHLINFHDVARDYLKTYAPRLEHEMAWFAAQSLTLPEAIERACASMIDGRVHSHQRRPFGIWPAAPEQAADLLTPLADQIGAARHFTSLHTIIVARLGNLRGIGDLAYYDIARRIGEWLRPKLEPAEVYLHRGAREGARALGVNGDLVPMNDFPKAFQSLTPAQMEDLLCVYRTSLARIPRNGDPGRETVRDAIIHCAERRAHPRGPRPGRC